MLSIILIFSSFPPFSIPFAGILGLSLFFYSLSKIESLKATIAAGASFGFLFSIAAGKGIIFSSVIHYAKTPMFALLFFTASVALPSGILHGLFSALFNILKSESLAFRIMVAPALWILFEYLREIIPGSIPWANMGYMMMPCLPYVQIADFAGIYGVSFIVASCAGLLSGIYSCYNDREQIDYRQITILIAFVLIPLIYGQYRISSFDKKFKSYYDLGSGSEINSICVQGSHSPSDRWRGLEFFGRFSTYKSMTAEMLANSIDASKPSIIVWPESVLNMSSSTSETVFRDISALMGKNSVLISGGIRNGAKGSFNSAYIFPDDGTVLAYDKNILLPYAEKAVSSFKIGSFQGAPDEFIEGKTKPYFKAGNLDLGISICLEDLYPGYVRKSVDLGAKLLINISADDWFGKTGTAEMHLDAARMRAIENRKFMIRCANSGVSAIISATGKLEKQTRLFERSAIQGISVMMDEKSFYSKNGDFILLISAIIIISSFIKIIFSRQ
ncbi:apolipoprotein N-acyltransferase [Desulforegula conservatrix]|uniref:apolipoprotein N-acyltransferase n=1 Tax=Desulforegula conservatrix TaxID=153026 RepID=UPI00041D423E|nr:apolipoprotein N-acyltransferase [Desulforegula conservatrix]